MKKFKLLTLFSFLICSLSFSQSIFSFQKKIDSIFNEDRPISQKEWLTTFDFDSPAECEILVWNLSDSCISLDISNYSNFIRYSEKRILDLKPNQSKTVVFHTMNLTYGFADINDSDIRFFIDPDSNVELFIHNNDSLHFLGDYQGLNNYLNSRSSFFQYSGFDKHYYRGYKGVEKLMNSV